MSVAASAAALQSPNPADCRHARVQFDAYFREALKGRGLTSDQRVIYAYLVSQTRIANGAPVAETIDTIARECEVSYHHTWAALKGLAEDGLVKTVRRGLGLSNTYELLPIPGVLDTEDIVGKRRPESGVRPVRGQQSGQSGPPARAYISEKKNGKNDRYTGPKCFGCGGPHDSFGCPKYGKVWAGGVRR